MTSQPGSTLDERKERGLALLEQILGKTKAEEEALSIAHKVFPEIG